MASREIETLTDALARLPGLGPRSARRAVLHLIKRRESALGPLVAALSAVERNLVTCTTCGNVDTSDPCAICADPRRDARSLCVREKSCAVERPEVGDFLDHAERARIAARVGADRTRIRRCRRSSVTW